MSDRVIITKGEKVALVVPEKQDMDLWYKGINNPAINKYLKSGNNIWSLEAEEKFYESINKDESSKVLCIMNLNSNKVIGNTGLHNISSIHRNAEIGIVIFKQEEHSKGFGTESLKLMLDYGFNRLNLRKIRIEYCSGNKAGEIVYNRIGFKEIGRYKQEYFSNGKYEDRVMMEIFKEQFYEKNQELLK